MAKKKNSLTFLQMPLPQGRKHSQSRLAPWNGIYLRPSADTGTISNAQNISLEEYPYITPAQNPSVYKEIPNTKILGALGYDNKLVVVYKPYDSEKKVLVNYIEGDNTFTGVLNNYSSDDKADYSPRSIVRFNVYDNPTDPVEGGYTKKLLIFPDKVSMPAEIDSNNFSVDGMDVLIRDFTDENPPESASHNYYYRKKSSENSDKYEFYRWVDDLSDSSKSGWQACVPPSFPPIKYAAVHLSRLFGVSDDRVYASGFNDYTNWNLDTVTEYNEANAWCTPSQSNTDADGNFTGITVFSGHVVCFKQDFMHEIYNTKNPFRIQDIYADGAIDMRSIAEVNGKLIFVSSNGVKVYTGGAPKNIGYPLGIDKFEKAISGTDGRRYYLYCSDGNERFLFVYDTATGLWAQQSVPRDIVCFSGNDNGFYAFCNDEDNHNAYIYKLDSKDYNLEWGFDTDLITAGTLDVKHIKCVKILADIGEDATIEVYAVYDDNDEEQLLYESKSITGRRAIRVKPSVSAHHGMKLRFKCKGKVRIYNLELTMEGGGETYVTR